MNTATVDLWRLRHQFCEDEPPPITDLNEARFVLGEHAGHGPDCLQYFAALARASEPVG
ncbi:hypothetical protein [Nocardia terpenica]|uniref:Uncharacterized protein n=1 Tax=Nocardia terpenica TaxID=455432 RepID=A0A6G9Z6S8_9NOCA|nr:hypothetical protein [Nocardia terpenica]QIS21101.1 hypothetical protein F6W96_25055 [Nocardia terpenica]